MRELTAEQWAVVCWAKAYTLSKDREESKRSKLKLFEAVGNMIHSERKP